MTQTLEGHTVRRYDGDLNNLHLRVLEMGGLALDQLRTILKAFRKKNPELVSAVILREQELDTLELNADDQMAAVIARRGPVARDLRIILSLGKAITDLERIGDEAARIAHLADLMLNNETSPPNDHLLRDICTMGKLISQMLEEGLAVVDQLDLNRAIEFINRHHELDEEFQSSLRRLTTFVLEDARNIGHVINITLVLKALERIGDHSFNLAEYVVYLLSGEDVRHKAARGPMASGVNEDE